MMQPQKNKIAAPAANCIDVEEYARNIAREWCNIQRGQPVLIIASKIHEALVAEVAEQANAAGASEIHLDLINERETLDTLAGEKPVTELQSPPEKLAYMAHRIVDGRGALVRILGDEFLATAENTAALQRYTRDELSARNDALDTARREAFKPLSKSTFAGLINRCIVAAPTPVWAKQIFPNELPDIAFQKLDRAIAASCLMDQADPLQAFYEFSNVLEAKRTFLQNLQIKKLRFVGNDTDITFRLSERAKWLGGIKYTVDERKIPFFANVPIGEVFTTPDWRGTSGHARITKPAIINDVVVDGITLTFEDGLLVPQKSFASVGQNELRNFIAKPNANKAGEIALVSRDSPVSKTDLFYHEILFDEKADDHFAAGQGYKIAITDSGKLSEDDFEAIGFNNCNQHIDVIFGGETMAVYAELENGDAVLIKQNGLWV